MSKTAAIDHKALRAEARASQKRAFREGVYRFSQNKATVVSLIVIVILLLLAIFAPVLTPYRYDAVDPIHANLGPCLEHPFGTDDVGRDLLSRVLYARGIQSPLHLLRRALEWCWEYCLEQLPASLKA